MKLSIFEVPEMPEGVCFSSSSDVFDSLIDLWKADREIFKVLFLNAKNFVIGDEVISVGDVDTCAVYPRQIFRSALRLNASSIICVHNHPSGDPAPSEGDRDITRKIVAGGDLLGIKVLDHIICGRDRYFSFADQGLIGDYENEDNPIHLSFKIGEIRRMYGAIQSLEEKMKMTSIARGKLKLDAVRTLLPYKRMNPEELLALKEKLNESFDRIIKLKKGEPVGQSTSDSR